MPKLTYGAETLAWTKVDVSNLKEIGLRFLRSVDRKPPHTRKREQEKRNSEGIERYMLS
jgi:hypothetical protein